MLNNFGDGITVSNLSSERGVLGIVCCTTYKLTELALLQITVFGLRTLMKLTTPVHSEFASLALQ